MDSQSSDSSEGTSNRRVNGTAKGVESIGHRNRVRDGGEVLVCSGLMRLG